jgi:microcin C transport system substrate-binding protein
MMKSLGLHRREFLALGGAALIAPQLPKIADAQITTQTPMYGISVFGDLKYPADFKHLEYVNPDAPKGGRIVPQAPAATYNQNFNTFDTLNMFVLRGNGPFGMDLTFASLMQATSDELSSAYAYVARSVTVSDDKRTWQFEIDPEAYFHDGTPIKPVDIVFSLMTLRDKGHENLASCQTATCRRFSPSSARRSFQQSGGKVVTSRRRCQKRRLGPVPTGWAASLSAPTSNSSESPIIGPRNARS